MTISKSAVSRTILAVGVALAPVGIATAQIPLRCAHEFMQAVERVNHELEALAHEGNVLHGIQIPNTEFGDGRAASTFLVKAYIRLVAKRNRADVELVQCIIEEEGG